MLSSKPYSAFLDESSHTVCVFEVCVLEVRMIRLHGLVTQYFVLPKSGTPGPFPAAEISPTGLTILFQADQNSGHGPNTV